MNTTRTCLFGGALFCAGLISNVDAGVNPDMTFSGDIEVLEVGYISYSYEGYGLDYSIVNGTTEIDLFSFSLDQTSTVVFDALSWAAFNTWTDTMLFVFDDDGMPPTQENLIGFNDDFGYDEYDRGFDEVDDFNGSFSTLDSFLTLVLGPGDYTLAVASYYTDIEDFEFGLVSPEGYIATTDDIVERGDAFFSGQYQVDVFIDPVPSPASIAVLGFAGVLASKRRR